MKKIFILSILLTISNISFAGQNDGNTFLKYCSYQNKPVNELTDEEFGGLMFCYGALQGIDGMKQVAEIEGNTPIYCPPQNYGVNQGSKIFIKYMEEHPEKLHMSGTGLMIKALTKAFPCK